MAKIKLECLYCGKKWNDEVYNIETLMTRCSACGETKQIKLKEEKPGNNDFYGYNYKPPKVKKNDDY